LTPPMFNYGLATSVDWHFYPPLPAGDVTPALRNLANKKAPPIGSARICTLPPVSQAGGFRRR